MKKLEMKNVSKTFYTEIGALDVLEDITFNLNEGEIIAIVGPSGSGKSTLLNIISKLIEPTEGEIYVDGEIGYMFQRDHLFNWRTVWKNIMLGLEIKKEKNQENIDKTKELLTKYGLIDFINSYPQELSGGMRQRIALIRTLATNPQVLLLDEPFSALDYQTRISVSNDVCNIIKNEKKTLIIVTHDISEAISMCNKIIVMSKRPSTIKKTYNIDYDFDRTNPIKSRSSKEFMEYYEKIWEDLNDEK